MAGVWQSDIARMNLSPLLAASVVAAVVDAVASVSATSSVDSVASRTSMDAGVSTSSPSSPKIFLYENASANVEIVSEHK